MTRSLVLRVGPVSRRTTTRAVVVRSILLVLVLACGLTALAVGSRPLAIPEVLAALAPGAEGIDRMVVVEWRAPRAAAAVLFGACLGVSGAIFQSFTRNPLGSPDIIGLNTGAYTGVVAVLMLGGTGYAAQAGGALAGGLGAAALVYLLAFRRGLGGFRLIIVGIAISATLSSINTWFSVKADLGMAIQAAVWGAGSLNGVDWPVVATSALVAVPLILTLPGVGRSLRQIELGDDAAKALGLPVERRKAFVVVVGVALTALVTAVAGPVAFIALAAPPIAARISGRGTSSDLLGPALVGALLLGGSDLIAQHAIPGATLPVGAVTVCIGGGYLIWLLIRESGRS